MNDSIDEDVRLEDDLLNADERDRSNFVRKLVQHPNSPDLEPSSYFAAPPKQLVQFWDDLERLPEDVRECMDSWKVLEQEGFNIQVFDESAAKDFIRSNLGPRYGRRKFFSVKVI